VGRIGGDDASFDRIGEDAAEEPDGSRGRSGAARTIALPRSFFVLTATRVLPP